MNPASATARALNEAGAAACDGECPACGDKSAPLLEFRGFTLRHCSPCALGYVDPATVARKPFDAGYLQNLLGAQARSEDFFERELRSLRRRLPLPGARILDVGFGAGTFLGLLLREGALAHGAEISEAACEHVRRRLPDVVVSPHAADLRSAPFAPRSFDLVTFWDSLQYMQHPLTQLAAAHGLLKRGGVVALQVPRRDAQCLWYARQLHRLHPDLARAFLRRAFDRLGFEVLDIHGYRPRLRPQLGGSAKSAMVGLANEGYALLARLSGRRVPVIVTARKRGPSQ
jgi:SAM-dependent methyltransferase